MNANYSIKDPDYDKLYYFWSGKIPYAREADFIEMRLDSMIAANRVIEGLWKTSQSAIELPVEISFTYRGECQFATKFLERQGITLICKDHVGEPCDAAPTVSQKVNSIVSERLPEHHKHTVIFNR